MNEYGIGIKGVSHHLPEKHISNEELCEFLPDITPEWIIKKTGIKRRYIIAEDENASDLAMKAINKLLENTDVTGKEIGLIIVASFSQDYQFPPLSAKIHKELNAVKECQIIDINVNCTGLVTAMTMAAERMQSNDSIKFALVVGVEVLSRFTNREDSNTSVFFSDGASAVLLEKVRKGYGLINSNFFTDSSTYESVRLRGGGSSYPTTNTHAPKTAYIEQNGLATWKQAVGNLPVVLNAVVKASNLTIPQIDFFVFHQANSNLINYILKKLKIPEDHTYNNVEEIGNTGSASIGIALSEAHAAGMIKNNSYLLLAGVGAGFNFGASVWRIE